MAGEIKPRTKCLWWFVPIALAVLVIVLCVGSSGPGRISARLIGRTLDQTGQVHIVYEIRNGTSSTLELRITDLQERHGKTGWWKVRDRWPAVWYPDQFIEKTSGVVQNPDQVFLGRGSAVRLEILAPWSPSQGLAVRGKLWHIKIERKVVTEARSFTSRAGLPRRWLMWPKPGLTDLPEAELADVALSAAPPSPETSVPRGPPALPTAWPRSEQILPVGAIVLRQLDLQRVLDIYADLAGAPLEIDPRVRVLNAQITYESTQSLARSDAIRLLGQAMQDQAGIVIKPSGKDRIEVRLDEKPKGNPIR